MRKAPDLDGSVVDEKERQSMAITAAETAMSPPSQVTTTHAPIDVERLGIPTVIQTVLDLLGPSITTVIAGGVSAHVVEEWVSGRQMPDGTTAERLRNACRVATMIAAVETPETVRSWFVGMNPNLDDHPAVFVIADDPNRVLDAARSFVVHG